MHIKRRQQLSNKYQRRLKSLDKIKNRISVLFINKRRLCYHGIIYFNCSIKMEFFIFDLMGEVKKLLIEFDQQ